MSAMFPFCLKSVLEKLYQFFLEDFTNPIPDLYIPSMTILSGDCTTYILESMMWQSSLPLSHWGKWQLSRLRILPWARSPESVEYLYSHFSHSVQKKIQNFLQESDKGQIFYWSIQTCTRIMLLFDWLWPCSRNLKTALFQTFSTWHPNTFRPYCLILT